jgi:hypothetical protein
MTVTTTISRNEYAGNGVQTTFTYAFEIGTSADIVVYVDGVLKALTTDYTLTGVGGEGGGTVVFLSAPANGAAVTLVRSTSRARGVDYQNAGAFRAEVVNADFDRLTRVTQELDDSLDRAVRLPESDPAATVELPAKADRASKFLAFDGNGNAIAATGTSGDLTPVSSFINTLLDDANAAAARTTLGAAASATTISTAGPLSGGGDLSANRTHALLMPFGQCRLAKSGSDLLLSRRNGSWLFINGAYQQVPAAGVSLAATGIRGAATVSNRARASNVATLTFGSAHGYSVGDLIAVYLNSTSQTAGVYCGNHTVASVPTSTTLTYSNTGSDEGSTASTTISAIPIYYIYAYMSGSTMTLEASTTVPATDTTYGHRIKTGDSSRTLVGMAASSAGGAWEDDDTTIFVLSYFNREKKTARKSITANVTGIGATTVERTTSLRVFHLTWGDSADELIVNHHVWGDTQGAAFQTFIQDDQGAARVNAGAFSNSPQPASYSMVHAILFPIVQSQGMHMLTTQEFYSVGSGTIHGSSSTPPSTNRVAVMG